MPPTWFKNALVLTQNSDRDILHADIRVEGSRITAIHPKGTSRAHIQPTDEVVDLTGKTLIPGLIQCHVHLCQTLFRNLADELELLDWLSKRIWPGEAAHTRETMQVSAEWGISELLASGTTTVLDMGSVRHTDVIFEVAAKSGIRANIGKCLMDRVGQNPANLCEKTDAALDEANSLFEKWNGREDGRLQASFAPRFAISVTEELLSEVGKLAKQKGAIVHSHTNENKSEVALVEKLYGVSNISVFEKFGLLSDRSCLAHGVHLSETEQKQVIAAKSTIVHCPSSNLKLASGMAQIPTYLKSGMRVALGADGAPCNNRLGLWGEMRLASLIHKPKFGPRAMSAQTVFDLATLGGAKALGLENEIGSIEVGKKADFVVLDLEARENFAPFHADDTSPLLSALIYAAGSEHVVETWVDGKQVYSQSAGFMDKSLNWDDLKPRVGVAQANIFTR